MSVAYRLEVALTIREMDRDSSGYERHTSNALTVNESIPLGTVDFRGLLEVMAGLHDAVKGLQPETTGGPA